MSSYSGEVGLIYRTGYCATKFAVTGFFESLRMETQGQIDITIVCPPTVETNLRKNALIFQHHKDESDKKRRKEPPAMDGGKGAGMTID